ncbi:MAG: hypothetical protein LBB21_05885 [Holosporaceae bacterium]|jgi:hypothetical protein|nr:hypothetical protein [Holosporaceae bacterium]
MKKILMMLCVGSLGVTFIQPNETYGRLSKDERDVEQGSSAGNIGVDSNELLKLQKKAKKLAKQVNDIVESVDNLVRANQNSGNGGGENAADQNQSNEVVENAADQPPKTDEVKKDKKKKKSKKDKKKKKK